MHPSMDEIFKLLMESLEYKKFYYWRRISGKLMREYIYWEPRSQWEELGHYLESEEDLENTYVKTRLQSMIQYLITRAYITNGDIIEIGKVRIKVVDRNYFCLPTEEEELEILAGIISKDDITYFFGGLE